MYEPANVASQHQILNNRLKKKRILKKPNIAEAGEQFEVLAIRSEGCSDFQTAGLCFRSAAKCAGSLGHFHQEANLLIRAGRLFANIESSLSEGGLISTEEHLQEALQCYHEAKERLQQEDKLVAGIAAFELGYRLKELGRNNAALDQLHIASDLLKGSPSERCECLKQIMYLLIEQEEYDEALELCCQSLEVLETVPANGSKDVMQRDLLICRLLLLLSVEPTSSQVTVKNAQFLEKLTWIENGDCSGELVDISSCLVSAGLSCFSVDLFLMLQSLVMAMQSGDVANAIYIESALQPFLSPLQLQLLRTLLKKIDKRWM